MTKVLNLDDFQTENDKTLTFKGVDHAYAPFSVEQFIEQMKEAETADAKGETKISENIEYMVKMIMRAFPTLPEKDLRKMPVTHLRKISDFVNDVDETEKKEASDQVKVDPATGE